MRSLAAAAITLTILGAGATAAQQSAPAISPVPQNKAMPPKEEGEVQVPRLGNEGAAAASRAASGQNAAPALPQAGPGQVAIVRGADPATILDLARKRGDARLSADDHGDPLVEAIVGGRPYDITFYECTDNVDCRSVMLRAAFRARGQTGGEMADWNRTERFGKAYLDAQGNPVIEMNVNMAGGVTLANLEDTLTRWQTTLDAFAGHVGY